MIADEWCAAEPATSTMCERRQSCQMVHRLNIGDEGGRAEPTQQATALWRAITHSRPIFRCRQARGSWPCQSRELAELVAN